MEMGQYVKWKAKVPTGYMTGGTGDPLDVNVDAVPADQVQQFIVSGVFPMPTITLMITSEKELWYRSGQRFTPEFPMSFGLKDESTLTIARNSDAPGDLIYTQHQ